MSAPNAALNINHDPSDTSGENPAVPLILCVKFDPLAANATVRNVHTRIENFLKSILSAGKCTVLPFDISSDAPEIASLVGSSIDSKFLQTYFPLELGNYVCTAQM